MDPQNQVPSTLVPVLCLTLALVILFLCLVGFCLFCLSAFISWDCSEEEEEEDIESAAGGQDSNGKVRSSHSESCEGDKPSHDGAGCEDLAVKLSEKRNIEDMCVTVGLLSSTFKHSLLQREIETVCLEDETVGVAMAETMRENTSRERVENLTERCKEVRLEARDTIDQRPVCSNTELVVLDQRYMRQDMEIAVRG